MEHSEDLEAMLKRRYARTNPHYLWNREFVSTVTNCQQQILNNKNKSYVFLVQFNKTLKVNVRTTHAWKFSYILSMISKRK